ncbi:hypothetical protein [Tuwongella immobilis]|uniref:Di-haem cytochrome c peroxidase family protein n=1 Tax=Tuwongella immobilis TaxID=692036 RepID=A0A6C2YLI1_9BACT|nr:hypothetical protein [Tuwongella immobilis]VIP02227.1 Di-haem cytochrome c peroxidase family protein OS=Blastopirellula marina DSM 3645 GN=DSM3645_07016 PE=4 SV=1 [Tuwongella immobilis]VTS00768.1 Di-haem cytochrome c peroxidase family protein OS=Blastopirellula marina DSM 3645 GN=DSM3645_07016 PE=4 SV=1 [Tuwongella immobilis]
MRIKFAASLGLGMLLLGWASSQADAPPDSPPMSPPDNPMPMNPNPGAQTRHPLGHAHEGLPLRETGLPIYAPQPDHWLNDLHAALFTQAMVPADVGGVLPGEMRGKNPQEFFIKGWQFAKRKGEDADLTTFGGDVRVSAVIAIDDARRKRLLAGFARISTPEQVQAIPELRSPLRRLMLQWDILSVWWRWESDRKWSYEDSEVRIAAAKSIRALAQPRAVLESLPSGRDELLQQFANHSVPGPAALPYLPPSVLVRDAQSEWVEIDRKASKLFRGDVALRNSRVFLRAGTRDQAAAIVEAAAKKNRPAIPDQTEVALEMTLIGVDPEFNPVVTPVIDEFRIRRLSGPFQIAAANPTSSKDGVDHWVYFRARTQLDATQNLFRFIPDTTQGLFLEYGSAKQTTFGGQCALCHRADINTPTLPRGISTLNWNALPKIATDPKVRIQAVVSEMTRVTEQLRSRVAESK